MDQYQDFDQDAYQDYLRRLVKYQVAQNPDVAKRFMLVHSQDGGQIYQSLQLHGAPTRYSDDDAMEITDSQSYFDQGQLPPSFTPSWITNENVREKSRAEEYVDESVDEDEFETDEEARAYAIKTSWELFEEIVDECIAELGTPGVLVADESWRQHVCGNFVFPDVWLAMGGTL